MLVEILTSLLVCACFAFALQKAFLFFQQSGYKTNKYYFAAFRGRYLITYILAGGAALIFNILNQKWGCYAAAGGAAAMLAVALTIKNRGKVKYTKRAVRIFVASLLTTFAAAFFLPCLSILLFPLLLPLSTLLLFPLERLINAYYIGKAKKRVANSGAIKIGITGSYGKTSVKNILCTMLSSQYRCIAAPKSYNTPLGIASFVNSLWAKKQSGGEGLEEYQFVIFELGAKRKGDIAKLCKMTMPQYGILTAIDGCHLETFLTLENVAECKRELLEHFKSYDVCVLSADSPLASQSGDRAACIKIFAGLKGNDVCACDLILTHEGSFFTLRLKSCELPCFTPLLGSHSVSNICLATALAENLGVTAENIQKSIGGLSPVPHRLSIINKGGITIIDDSYNANLRGVEALTEVLGLFDKRRIVVTQGVVEGGRESEEVNIEVGKKLSAAVDTAYIIGGNWAALKKGLMEGGMKKEDILFCKSVKDAAADMQRFFDKPTVAAFQNDLPDCFN